MPKAWELPDHHTHMYIYTITGMGTKISHEIGKMAYIANICMRDFNDSLFKIQNLNRH